MKENNIKEKSTREIVKIQMVTIVFLIIGIVSDVIYEFFILEKGFYEVAVLVVTLLISITYVGIKLYNNKINFKNENKIKRFLLKESILIAIFFTFITYALGKEMFYIIVPENSRLSFFITFSIEIILVLGIVYFTKIFIGKILKKIRE